MFIIDSQDHFRKWLFLNQY